MGTTAGTPDTLRQAVTGSVIGKGIEVVTLALLATVVPRLLGPSDYGAFSVPLTVVTLGVLALTLGGAAVLGRFVPMAAAGDRPALALALGRRLAWGRAAQLAALTLAAAGLAVGVRGHDVEGLTGGRIAIVVAALWLGVAAQLALQVGLGLGRTRPWSLRYPVHNAVRIVGVFALYPAHGLPGAVLAILAANVAAAVLGAAVVAPIRSGAAAIVDLPDGAIRFGRLQAAGAALTQFAQRGGVLAAAVFASGTEAAGFAALAVGIALGATYAVLQAFTVMLPELSTRTDGADRPSTGPHGRPGDGPTTAGAGRDRPGRVAEHLEGQRIGELAGQSPAELRGASGSAPANPHSLLAPMRRLAGLALAVLVPGVLAALVVLEPVLDVVVGDDFAAAAPAFVPAAAVIVLAPLHSMVVQLSALRLRPEVALWSGLAAAGVFSVVAVIAVPAAGPDAAGDAATAALGATLAGCAAGLAVGVAAFRDDLDARLLGATAAGAGLVLVIGALTVA